MEKPNVGSEHDKDAKQQQGVKGETRSADTASRDTDSGRMERVVGDAVSTTGRVGSGMVEGVAHVATDLVHGVGTIAGEAVTVARDTANSAIVGVGSIGETAVHTVTGLLSDLMGGLRDIGSTAARGRTHAGTETEIHREEAHRHREEAIH